MRTVIYVRTNVDWSKMNFERFRNQPREVAPAGKSLDWLIGSRLIADWNALFKLDYWTFRYKLQQIAMESLRAVKNTEIIVGLKALKKELADPKPCYIMPIDDDDWFCPELANKVAKATRGLVCWPIVGCTHNKCKRLSVKSMEEMFRPNSYAI